MDQDCRAFLGETLGDGAADAAGSAGDEGQLVFKGKVHDRILRAASFRETLCNRLFGGRSFVAGTLIVSDNDSSGIGSGIAGYGSRGPPAAKTGLRSNEAPALKEAITTGKFDQDFKRKGAALPSNPALRIR